MAGSGVQGIVTSKADIVWGGSGFSITALNADVSIAEVRDGCGFELSDSVKESTPPDSLFELLESIDPSRVRDLEARVR